MSWNRPAEQVVHRFPERLADDVPARHVDGAQQRGGDGAGMEHGVAPEHVPPDALPAHRIGALQNLLEDLLRHLQRRLPVGAVPGTLAGALDPFIGDQLDENPVLAALAGRRHRHEIALKLFDLHAGDGSRDRRSAPMRARGDSRWFLREVRGFVGGGTVERWDRNIVEPQVHAELRAVVDQMVEHETAQHRHLGHGHEGDAILEQRPGPEQIGVAGAGDGGAGGRGIAVEGRHQRRAVGGRWGNGERFAAGHHVQLILLDGQHRPGGQVGQVSREPPHGA